MHLKVRLFLVWVSSLDRVKHETTKVKKKKKNSHVNVTITMAQAFTAGCCGLLPLNSKPTIYCLDSNAKARFCKYLPLGSSVETEQEEGTTFSGSSVPFLDLLLLEMTCSAWIPRGPHFPASCAGP